MWYSVPMPKSLLGKKWKIKNIESHKTLLEQLLANRNLKTEKEIERFLHPDIERDLYDPFLMEDMELAVERIKRAIDDHERIIIFGDYDIDGITGTAILVHILKTLGANVSYRLPTRQEDGYGLREKFIKEFAELDIKVLITVDNGISAAKEISLAKKNGIDVIVTDHHSMPAQMPQDAWAILHPGLPKTKYPFNGLTGSAVAFKFAEALIKTFMPARRRKSELMPLLDLAAMGVISDMGPLVGENRAIVKFGLAALANTRWPGLRKLKEKAGINGNVSVHNIGFHIGPRINAAGRMSNPYYALQLLLDDGKKSEALAEKLEQLNSDRQKITADFLAEAEEKIKKQIEDDEKILIAYDAKWHSGVIGLIAGKLAEMHCRPAIVLERRKDIMIGSARSPIFFNITKAISACGEFLSSYGGHAQAAGLEIPAGAFLNFEAAIRKIVNEQLKNTALTPSVELDCELIENDLSLETYEMLNKFAPFGMGNEAPLFLLRNVLARDFFLVGKERKHLKFNILCGSKQVECIAFGMGHLLSNSLHEGEPVDLACEMEINEWQGKCALQLKVTDIRAT